MNADRSIADRFALLFIALVMLLAIFALIGCTSKPSNVVATTIMAREEFDGRLFVRYAIDGRPWKEEVNRHEFDRAAPGTPIFVEWRQGHAGKLPDGWKFASPSIQDLPPETTPTLGCSCGDACECFELEELLKRGKKR